MNNENGNADDEKAGGEPGWVDRHLTKIVVAAAVLCALALIGRAMTG